MSARPDSQPINPVMASKLKAAQAESDGASTFEQLRSIIVAATGFEPAEVKPTSRFDSDLPIDSLAKIEIAVRAEDHFSVRIEDDQIAHIEGVEDFLEILSSVDGQSSS